MYHSTLRKHKWFCLSHKSFIALWWRLRVVYWWASTNTQQTWRQEFLGSRSSTVERSSTQTAAAGTFLRFFQTIFENAPLWRLKRLVTLSTYRRYINECIYLSIYLTMIKRFWRVKIGWVTRPVNRGEPTTSYLDPNLSINYTTFMALHIVLEIWRGSQNSKSRSCEPFTTPFDQIFIFFRMNPLWLIRMQNLKSRHNSLKHYTTDGTAQAKVRVYLTEIV